MDSYSINDQGDLARRKKMTEIKKEDIEVEKVEVDPLKDLKDELMSVEKQIQTNQARLDGGINPMNGMEQLSIGDEIEQHEMLIEMRTIQHDEDAPTQPHFMWERNERFRELNRKGLMKQIDKQKATLARVKEQKEVIDKEMPILQQRLELLKTKLDAPGEIKSIEVVVPEEPPIDVVEEPVKEDIKLEDTTPEVSENPKTEESK